MIDKPMSGGRRNIAPGETRVDTKDRLLRLFIHASEGKSLCEQGIDEATGARDNDLAALFRDSGDAFDVIAARAKALLEERKRANRNAERDIVTESSMESFPASDPPAY